MWGIIEEAFVDSVRMIPFLFAAYVLMECIEHKSSERIGNVLRKFGPVGGAILGCFPQCGFSVAAANLYAGRVISIGTVIAVLISTSDEAILVILSNPGSFNIIIKIILVKIVIAVAVGATTDRIIAISNKNNKITCSEQSVQAIQHMCEDSDCGCESGIFVSALKHTATIFAFVFVVTLVMDIGINLMGEDQLSRFLLTNSIFQPIVAAIVGLIPNCAASVILTELYLSGGISFGSMIAGLCTGAGVGFIVLFKSNKNISENFKIVCIIFLTSVIAGTVIQLF